MSKLTDNQRKQVSDLAVSYAAYCREEPGTIACRVWSRILREDQKNIGVEMVSPDILRDHETMPLRPAEQARLDWARQLPKLAA